MNQSKFLKTLLIVLVVFLMSVATIGFLGCGDDDDDDVDDDDDDDDDNNDGDDDDDDDDDENDDDDDDDDDDDAGDDDDDANAPSYPDNHDAGWDCYICHTTSIEGKTTPEPHGGTFNAPTDCIGCHEQGDWANPFYEDGHNWSANCLTCHGGKHGKSWEEKAQCLVCHGQS